VPGLWGHGVSPREDPTGIILGPRTTVFALLTAYPFLDQFLLAYGEAFLRLGTPGGRTGWARKITLDDVALDMNVTWRRLVREIGDEVTRVIGRGPAVVGSRSPVAVDDWRLVELRGIAARLEAGGSLVELAGNLRDVTAGLDSAEALALDRALAAAVDEARSAADRSVETAAGESADAIGSQLPRGHPVDTLRREAVMMRQLCADLRAELARLGGSASRRRWRASRSLVERLVRRLSEVEQRFRRQQQAWFPALAVLGVEGPAALMSDRQAEALESLRRLRLAVARDDAAIVVETGTRLLELLDDLLSIDEQVLVPLAERHLAAGDWAAVREMEDGLGWSLIPAPPPWPTA